MKKINTKEMLIITGGVTGSGCFFTAIVTAWNPGASLLFGGWGYLKECYNS